MKITPIEVKVKDLVENYHDDGDDGVFGYNNRLTIRPSFQREFVYNDKQRNAVIDTVMNDLPLNIMYWSKVGEDSYEVIDGQQRTISVAQYVHGDFPVRMDGNDRFFHNLTDNEKAKLLNYDKLFVYVCEGTEEEKLEWFKTINIAGATLTAQELLNAVHTGPWLADAKSLFSKRNCVASKISEGYMRGNPIRQDYLAKVLAWIADRDGLASGQQYMAAHQHDKDANDLWVYFQNVINWAKMLFPDEQKGLTDVQDWGLLYNKYHEKTYNSKALKEELDKLIMDDDVTKNAGIIPYILSEKTKNDEKHLSIRTFTEPQKRRAYLKQNGICPSCGQHFEYEEMQGDHIVPWSKGGKTVDDNLQMLCQKCNGSKSNK